MMVVLLLSVAAAISIGYMSVVAEAGVRKLHEVQAIRRVVEALFLFSLIEALDRHAATQKVMKSRETSSTRPFDWSSGLRWVVVASIVAAALAVLIWWLSLSVLESSLETLLYIVVVAVVVLFLWRTLGRPKPR